LRRLARSAKGCRSRVLRRSRWLSAGGVQALVGNRKEAMESANTSLEIFQDYNQKLVAGEVLAFAGENKKALDQAGEIAKSRPDDVLVQAVSVPLVRAAAALSSGDAGQGDRTAEAGKRLRQSQSHGALSPWTCLFEGRAGKRSRPGVSAGSGSPQLCSR